MEKWVREVGAGSSRRALPPRWERGVDPGPGQGKRCGSPERGGPGFASSQVSETLLAGLETAGVRHWPHVLTSLAHSAGWIGKRWNECSHCRCARLRFKILLAFNPHPLISAPQIDSSLSVTTKAKTTSLMSYLV